MEDKYEVPIKGTNKPSDVKIIIKLTELIKQTNLYFKDSPKHEKYGLCNEIRQSLYRSYALATEAYKRRQKKTTLGNLDLEHEKVRMLFKLYFELGYFSYKRGKSEGSDALHRFKVINQMVDEVGRMIGGWIKADSEKSNQK